MISHRMGLCAADTAGRIESLLAGTGLPVRHDQDPAEIVSVMSSDKKVIQGRVRFVLINAPGLVEHGREVSPDLVKQVLEDLKGTDK
jgi:3-dehydroquinate synthetase